MDKNNQFLLNNIRVKHRITDYLASKDIFPVAEYGDRFTYLCPIHKETQPSFVVYKDRNDEGYQEYYCFGCKSNKCIVSLYSKLENVNWYQSIEQLGKDINIKESDEIEFIIKSLEKEIDQDNDNISHSMATMSLNISVMGFSHLIKTNYDFDEMQFLDNLYQKIDKCINTNDLNSLEKIYEFVSDALVILDKDQLSPFVYRFRQWEHKQNQLILECSKIYDQI